MGMTQKVCKNCKNEFQACKNDDRIVFCCEECRKEYRRKTDYMKSYYGENFDKWKERQAKESYKDAKNNARREKYKSDEEYRERIKTNVKKYYAQHPGKRRRQRMEKYGITPEDYDSMLDAQHGCCAICVAEVGSKSRKRLYVDHDHSTGKIRGLLCQRCNFGIGFFFDDVSLFKKAIHYLEGEK